MKKPLTYFKVVAVEGERSADLLLYGYIGQDFWWDDDLKEESLTDIAVIRQLRELESRFERINIRINSPGGSVFHGDPIIAAIQSSKAEIHAYNDGMAASMAADIWLAAPHRHMAGNAKLMIHATSTFARGTAKTMEQEAARLRKFDDVAIATMAKATGLGEEEIRSRFYDYEDHWITAREAEELGLITQVEDYEAQDIPLEVERMTYAELVRHFTSREDKEAKGWLNRMREKWLGTTRHQAQQDQPIVNSKTQNIMNAAELRESLQKGDLRVEDLVAELTGRNFKVETPEQLAQQQLADTLRSVVAEVIKPFGEKVALLEENMKQLGDKPGAGPTQAAPVHDPAAKEGDAAKADWLAQNAEANKAFANAVKNGEALKIIS